MSSSMAGRSGDGAERSSLNAKMRRTGICGAAETLLVDRGCAATHLAPLVETLLEAGCEVRGDEATRAVDPRVQPATEQDWYTEYLDAIIAVRVVEGLDAAIAHIQPLWLASHRLHRDRGCGGGGALPDARSTAPSCCTTPRPSSPTAASSAWARKSASAPQASCARSGRRRAAHELQICGSRHRSAALETQGGDGSRAIAAPRAGFLETPLAAEAVAHRDRVPPRLSAKRRPGSSVRSSPTNTGVRPANGGSLMNASRRVALVNPLGLISSTRLARLHLVPGFERSGAAATASRALRSRRSGASRK